MATNRRQANLPIVGGSQCKCAIVSLQNPASIVIVQNEESQIALTRLVTLWPCKCSIVEVDVELIPPAKLKDTLGGACADDRQISPLGLPHQVKTIKASADVREPESADQPLRDMVTFDRCQGWIGREQLKTIVKFETTNLQAGSHHSTGILEANAGLFDKDAAITLSIGGKIGSAKSKLSSRTGGDGPCRKPQ